MTSPVVYAPVLGDDVVAFLGRDDEDSLVTLAEQHAAIITTLARSYTRGQGFDPSGNPAPDIAAVITTATARLVSQPAQWSRLETSTPDVTISQLGGFQGWTLAELYVLNAYRRRAA